MYLHLLELHVMKSLITFLKFLQEQAMKKVDDLRTLRWKRKAVKRATALRDLRKKLARVDKRHEAVMSMLREENAQLKKRLGLLI